jgi:hypothetical protein
MLKTFTGFKGSVAFAQIDKVKFALVCKNNRDLELLWAHIMPGAQAIDPRGIKKAILIEAAVLQAPKGFNPSTQPTQPAPPQS